MFSPPPPRDSNSTGKFRNVSQRTVAVVERGTHRDWHYEISSRRLGVTVRRQQFSVSIRWQDRALAEHLGNYSSLEDARRVALARIDALEDDYQKRSRRSSATLRHSIPRPPQPRE